MIGKSRKSNVVRELGGLILIVLLCFLNDGCANQNLKSAAQSGNEQLRTGVAENSPNPKLESNAAVTQKIDSDELDKLAVDLIPAAPGEALNDELLSQLLREIKELRQCLKEEYDGDAADFKDKFVVQRYDFNDDGQLDFIIIAENRCGSMHNPIHYLYRATADKRIFMQSFASNEVRLKKNRTAGFFDLYVNSHTSCCSGAVDIYKFSNNKYRVSECFVWETVKENGHEKIKVKSHRCNQPT